jgi:formylmethanofuran dehydrogenase subunit E
MYSVRVFVGSAWLTYQVPNKRDHLLKVPRRIFPQSIDDEINEDGRITYGEVLCDACGEPINYPYVWVLILGNPWVCWGAICENCKERYHNKKPAYVMQ